MMAAIFLESPWWFLAAGDCFLPLLYFHCHQFFLHTAGFVRSIRSLLAAQSVRVSIFTCDAILFSEFFGSERHWQTTVGVRQAHHQRIFQRAATEFEAVAQPANHKRRLGHVFHATGKNQLALAEQQPLCCLRDRFNSRSAQSIYRHRGRFGFQPGFQGDVSGSVKRISAGLHHIAKNGVIELGRIRVRTANRFLRGRCRQINCRNIGKCAGVTRHRRARACHNYYVCWKHDLSSLESFSNYRKSHDRHSERSEESLLGSVRAHSALQNFGASSVTTVSPPRFLASSIELSARFIKSVTISSLSKSDLATAATIPALRVIAIASHGGRIPAAARRNLSTRFCAPSKVVSGKMNASDQEVYFTATSFWRTIGCNDRASCSRNFSIGDSPCCRNNSPPRSICKIVSASGVPWVRSRSASVSKQLWYELRLSSPVRSSETPMRRTSERSRVWLTLISIWSPMACKKYASLGFHLCSSAWPTISIPAGLCVSLSVMLTPRTVLIPISFRIELSAAPKVNPPSSSGCAFSICASSSTTCAPGVAFMPPAQNSAAISGGRPGAPNTASAREQCR